MDGVTQLPRINEAQIIEQFRAAMRSYDIHVEGEIIADGQLHVAYSEGDKGRKKRAWYVLHLDFPPSGAFGHYSKLGTNKGIKWTSERESRPLSREERRALAETARRNRLKREAAERARHEQVAQQAAAIWEAAAPAEAHPYLVQKGVKAHGLRVAPVYERHIVDHTTGEIVRTLRAENALLIPMRDMGKKVWSLQAIFPDANNDFERSKDFLLGGRKRGMFHTIGKPVDKTICFFEGYATGASVHEVTGHAAVICFDAGNLPVVVAAFRERFPDYRFVIGADNDQWTLRPMPNPGVHYAKQAGKASNAVLAIPRFTAEQIADWRGRHRKGADEGPTDFNDLLELAGPDAVARQFADTIDPTAATPDVALATTDATAEYSPNNAPAPTPAPEPATEPEPAMPEPPDDDEEDQSGPATGYFTILGYDHDRYYVFQHERKQITVMTKGDLTETGLITLAPIQWWEREFPSDKGLNKKAAVNWFVRTAHAQGIYDPSRLRGRGAWVDAGRIVFHFGNVLWVDGKPTDVTKIESRYTYELERSLPNPDVEPLTAEEGGHLLEIAEMFRWTKPASAPLLAGWVALAPLCGALRWRPHIWLTGGAGSGKAQPHSAKVLTPTGWRTMGELKVGDMVSTPDNGYARILGVYPQGRKPVYRITFADGRSTRATGDHLWKVRIKHEWRIRTTEQMLEILGRQTRTSRSLAVPLCEPMTVRNGGSALMLPLHPYVLGLMLGDGQFANESGASSTGTNLLTVFDHEIVERAREKLEGSPFNFFDTNVKGRYRLGDLSRYGRKTRETIKELRLLGTRSGDKFIPRAYLDASIEDRIELLKGLMDTDGYIGDRGGMSFCTVSPRLRDDVVELVRSLGGIASVSEKRTSYVYNGEKREGQIAYNINIRLRDRAMASSLPRKLERVGDGYQYEDCLYLNVLSIEPDGEEECSCIAIDHPDRLYVTDDFVVTHNTTVLNEYVHALLNGMDVYAQGNSTEAGIRQTLRSDALPVLFDESESNEESDRKRIQGVLALIRQASSESAARTLKGTAGGDAMHFHIRSMFALASIQVGMKYQADWERLTVLALRPKRDDGSEEEKQRNAEEWRQIKEALYGIGRDEKLPARLFRRSLDLLPVTLKNIDVFAEVAGLKFGSQRDGDQYGTLMAGAWSLTHDGIATPEEARAWLDQYDWSEYLENADTEESVKALSALLEAQIRLGGGVTVNVYELVKRASGANVPALAIDVEQADAALQRHGMKIRGDRLLLSNNSQELRRLVAGTPYEADLRGQLLRVKGADRYNNRTQKFNGIDSKCISLPLSEILEEDDGSVLF